MSLQLRPFVPGDVTGAAALLAARHSRHRTVEAALPEAFDFGAAVGGVFEAPGASGAVALRDGALAGYLIGQVRQTQAWGRHLYVDLAAQAVDDPELLRDLYAAAAPAWVAAGTQLHICLVPALDDMTDAWFRSGFGHMQVYAIRESGGVDWPTSLGIRVRRGGHDDVPHLRDLQRLVAEHQLRSPVFSNVPPSSPDQLEADWHETLDEPGTLYFIAEREGRPVGHAVCYPAEADLATPPGSLYLGTTATLPEARGTGAGLALTAAVLRGAQEARHPYVVTNWRMTNLEASRFWPRRGFRPTFFRLYRTVNIG